MARPLKTCAPGADLLYMVDRSNPHLIIPLIVFFSFSPYMADDSGSAWQGEASMSYASSESHQTVVRQLGQLPCTVAGARESENRLKNTDLKRLERRFKLTKSDYVAGKALRSLEVEEEEAVEGGSFDSRHWRSVWREGRRARSVQRRLECCLASKRADRHLVLAERWPGTGKGEERVGCVLRSQLRRRRE
ncbi:hypothetical protein JCGZ_06437 [Jatropha curcas]|uniref:Uncharacterized protein n=1 Tax=Jatropha curcas TaxID=180498 RepID=A0A067KNI2_JATCU|nr:hypothetical protein JCGZ_06437 [Jatropha curcas]